MTWKFGRQTPDNNLMRFVARRFPYAGASFLDIGCGEGANARELWSRRHFVWSIDNDPEVKPPIKDTPAWHSCADIRAADIKGPFDCVYDINTLCHVETPPFEKIKSWLEPGGIFFSIWPAIGTWEGVANDKSYTRLMGNMDLRDALRMFSSIRIYGARSPAFFQTRDNAYFDSWIVEAQP